MVSAGNHRSAPTSGGRDPSNWAPLIGPRLIVAGNHKALPALRSDEPTHADNKMLKAFSGFQLPSLLRYGPFAEDTSFGDELFPSVNVDPCEVCESITLAGLQSGLKYRTIAELVASPVDGCSLCYLFKLAFLQAFDPKLDVGDAIQVQGAAEAHSHKDDQLSLFYEKELRRHLPQTGKLSEDLVSNQITLYTARHGPLSHGVGIYTKRDDSMAPFVAGRLISRRADTPTNFAQIRRWLEDAHGGPEAWEAVVVPLPKRLIDVENPSNPLVVHLRETEEGEIGRYICLSHCWSQSRPLRTTKKTLSMRMEAIKMSELSLTIRDAIELTRKLGIRYIWIDSMCIVQDSAEDWQIESSRMSDYYGSGLLTVSAGRDGPKGLFGHRVQPKEPYLKLETVQNGSPLQSNLYFSLNPPAPMRVPSKTGSEISKIYSRGWTLQEEYLSPRILSFEARQIYFRTREYEAYESGRKVAIGRQEREWRSLVEEYCRRSLTKETDKLPALSGLAHKYKLVSGDRYLAGLWRSDLLRQLLWTVESSIIQPQKPGKYRAPSWSWASVDAEVRFLENWDHVSTWSTNPRILEASTEPAGRDDLGEVKSGFLKLYGSLGMGEAYLNEKPKSTKPHIQYRFTTTHLGANSAIEMYFNADAVFPNFRLGNDSHKIFIMELVKGFCMILDPLDELEVTFRRIGVVETWGKRLIPLPNQVITII